MNSRALVESALAGDLLSEVPVAPLIGGHSAKLYGVSLKEAYRNPDLMARLQVKAAKYYDIDIVFHYMDTTLEPEALGVKAGLRNGLPTVLEHLIYLPEPVFEEKGRMSVFVEALKKISEELSAEKIIGGYVLGPFTLICQLLGLSRVFVEVMRGKGSFDESYLMKLANYSKGYVDLLVDRGKADLIMVLEPCLSLVRPSIFQKYAQRPLANLLQYIKNRGVISALHVCGRSGKVLPYFKELAFDIIQIDCFIKISDAKGLLPEKCILGNLDTKLFTDAEPHEIIEQAKMCIKESQCRKHILSAGCEVPLSSKPENIKALVKAAREVYA